jgi:hypothetical protein
VQEIDDSPVKNGRGRTGAIDDHRGSFKLSDSIVKDAENDLSYTDMIKAIEKKQPCRIVNGKPALYSWCGSRTGWHCACKKMRQSDIREMGVGISVYFKMLKFLMCLFLWFSFLSIPAYVFYSTGNEAGLKDTSIKYVLSALSLGNIG